ncbi:MAG: aspartate aminotransferase family protein, partial [Candidatus Binatia bacterium]
AALKELSRRGAYEDLEERGKKLADGLSNVLKDHRISGVVNRQGSMLTLFFGVERVRNAADARRSDKERFARFFHGMLERGIYWPPAQFEAAFVSLAHDLVDIDKAVQAFDSWARDDAKG